VWFVACPESQYGLSRQGLDESAPPVPSRDLVGRSFGCTLRAHSLSFLFPTRRSSILLDRDGNPTCEPSLASRCPGIHPRVAHAPAPGSSHPSDLPSQSVIHLSYTYVGIANTYIHPISVRAEVVRPVQAKYHAYIKALWVYVFSLYPVRLVTPRG
jgi:hypothetical protein